LDELTESELNHIKQKLEDVDARLEMMETRLMNCTSLHDTWSDKVERRCKDYTDQQTEAAGNKALLKFISIVSVIFTILLILQTFVQASFN